MGRVLLLMPYFHLPRKAEPPENHDVRVVPNVVYQYTPNGGGTTQPADSAKFPLKVICKCQFEALAADDKQADFYRRSHLKAHGIETEAVAEAVTNGQEVSVS